MFPAGLKEQMNGSDLKEQIKTAKLRKEKESSMSFQIAPLNPSPRLVPVDCQVCSVGERGFGRVCGRLNSSGLILMTTFNTNRNSVNHFNRY